MKPKLFLRSLLLLCLCVSFARGADLPRLRTLTGNTVEGELAGISDKEIVLRGKDGPVATPFAKVLDLELRPSALPAATTRYDDVELTDGSLLHCTEISLKNKEVVLKLVVGPEVKLPLSAVAHILREANDAKGRDDWRRLLAKQGNRDLLAVKKSDVLNGLEGTLGEADEKGETIGFELASGKKVRVAMDKVHGLSFYRKLELNEETPALCKVIDTLQDVLTAGTIAEGEKSYTVTTVAGARVEFPKDRIARLDFSKGRLAYLSDLEPVKKVEKADLGGINYYRRDKNLNDEPLCLAGKIYPKGLALQAYTELVYDIGGEYREFKAVLGVDDKVGGDSQVKFTIEGDNRVLYTGVISRQDPKPTPLAVDVRNVKQLRIVVVSVNPLGLGNHVDVADARVSK